MEEIEEWLRRHDDYHVEVKLGYDLNRSRRKDLYTVEYFFFLPDNLDVNPSTYTKTQFHRDLLLHIRFKAPELSLAALADASNERSPLCKIREKLENLRRDPTPYNATVLEYELKLLGCTLKDALSAHLRGLKKALGANGTPAAPDGVKASGILSDAVENSRAVAKGFRAFREGFEDAAVPPALKASYAFVDEYASILIEGYAHQMMVLLQGPKGAGLGGGLKALAGLVREELEHRRARGYPSMVDEAKDNETFVFRLGVLKKFVSGALHLSVRTDKEGKGIEELGLALGAGVAMVFASGIAYYYQKTYGTLSLYFFIALVISYMFKDRIKAMAQSYFLRLRSDRVMDLATDLFDPFSRERIGECRELVHFVPESKVDPVVTRLRDRDHITEIENAWRSEKVMHYLKEIELYPRRLNEHSRKTGLTDIARFDLRRFLLKMDEPRREVFLLKGERSETVPATRVYHVNMIIKFTDSEKIRYERVRMVLDQDGIKRLEPVRGEVVPLKK